MLIRIGRSSFSGSLRRYATHFDLVEVRTDAPLPKRARLAEWRAEVSEDFAFSVVLPVEAAALDPRHPSSRAPRAVAIATTLAARWIVVRSAPDVRPTARNRELLARLFESLRGARWRVGWEPSGPWEDDAAAALSRSLGVHLIVDLARVDAGPREVVYTRLRSLGHGRVTEGAAELAASRAAGATEVYVALEGAGAAGAARAFREALAAAADAAPGGSRVEADDGAFDDEDAAEAADDDAGDDDADDDDEAAEDDEAAAEDDGEDAAEDDDDEAADEDEDEDDTEEQ